MTTHCCPGIDAFDGCSCPDPDLHLDLDLCDDCGVRLEEKEVGLCNECEENRDSSRDEDFSGEDWAGGFAENH